MKFILILLLFFSSCRLFAQLTASEAHQRMVRGINLGNTMEPEQEAGWNNDSIQEHYFDAYKAAGFSTVRIPIRWDKHTSEDAPFSIDASWLARVEQVVDWALARDLFVIINAHHEQWFKASYQAEKDRMDSIWSQVSVHFKNKSEKLFFEMLNEPTVDGTTGLSLSEINSFNKRVLDIIRKDNPTRIVIYSGNGWTAAADLKAADIPDTSDDYLIGTYHAYNPWTFAGTGSGTWGSAAQVSTMKSEFVDMKIWSDQKGIPILLGEFGSINTCDYNSRMYHYSKNVEYATVFSHSFCAWDDGGDFEIMLRDERSWNDIKDILIYSSDSSITDLEIYSLGDTAVHLGWNVRSIRSNKNIVQSRSDDTSYEDIIEITDTTVFVDESITLGETKYYRILDIIGDDTIPSYPISITIVSNDRSPYFDDPVSIPGTVEAEYFDTGREGLVYHDTDVDNVASSFRDDEGVDIEVGDDGNYHIGYVSNGEWVEYSISVLESGDYVISTYVASEQAGGRFQLEIGAVSTPVGIVESTGSWTTFEPLDLNVELNAGEQILKLKISNDIPFNIDKMVFSKASTLSVNDATDIIVYPNPTENTLTVKAPSNILELAIYDVNGREFRVDEAGHCVEILDVSHLSSGLYFIKVKTKECSKIINFQK